MKLIPCVLVVLLAVGGAVAAEPDPDQIAKDTVAVLKELREVLASIKDKETAEAAKPKLEALAKSQQKIEKTLDGLSKKESNAFEKKHRATVKPLQKDIDKEFARVEALPEAYAVVKDTSLFKTLQGDKETTARAQMATLTLALQDYHNRHAEYPPGLATLAEPQGKLSAYVEKRDLLDPWGREFKYDPKGPKNGGKKADIWSEGSPGGKGRVIGNWPEEKKPPKN